MRQSDLPWLSAAATAMLIKTKQVSPVEVVQAYLERIERLDRTLHAYRGGCTVKCVTGYLQ